MMKPDLRTLDYDGFVALIFDHPAYEGPDIEFDDESAEDMIEERPKAWYWDVDWFWSHLPTSRPTPCSATGSGCRSPFAVFVKGDPKIKVGRVEFRDRDGAA